MREQFSWLKKRSQPEPEVEMSDEEYQAWLRALGACEKLEGTGVVRTHIRQAEFIERTNRDPSRLRPPEGREG